MDYSKIKLENERNAHVTKRLNRLNTWKFFMVIYRENMWRVFGFSLLMLICIAPIIAVAVMGSINSNNLQQTLPVLNGFGFSTGMWEGVFEYYNYRVQENAFTSALLMAVSALLVTVVFSGGFAVIRDAFWTGKLSVVGVFKSMGKGFSANILYAFVSTAIISFGVFGLYAFYTWAKLAMDLWLAIVLLVLLCIVMFLLAMYLLILCSVTVTYKQSLKQNLDDSWRLMWLNIFPNIIHFVIMLLPIGLYFAFSGGMLQSLLLILLVMFGGIYFPLVWQTHMMKTFALFHPVEVKKKKATQQAPQQTPSQQYKQAKQQAEARKAAKQQSAKVVVKRSEQKTAEQPVVADEQPKSDDDKPNE